MAQKQLEPYIVNSLGSGPLKVIKYRFVKTGEIMTISENMEFWKNYQEQAWTTCMPSCKNWEYLTLGLQSEVGELCGKLKKQIRGDYDALPEQFIMDVKAEIGDIFWYTFSILKFKETNFTPKVFAILTEDTEVAADIYAWTIDLPSYASNLIRNFHYWIKDGDGCNFPELLSVLAHITRKLGFTLEDAATYNLEKLAKRYQTNKIIGSGDYR